MNAGTGARVAITKHVSRRARHGEPSREHERALRRCALTAGNDPPPSRGNDMNIFYIIGVVVVVLVILGFLGLR